MSLVPRVGRLCEQLYVSFSYGAMGELLLINRAVYISFTITHIYEKPGVLFTKVRTPVYVRKFCVRKFLRA